MGSTRQSSWDSTTIRHKLLVGAAIVSGLTVLIIGGRVISENAAEPTGLAVFDTPPEPSDKPNTPLPEGPAEDTRYLTNLVGWNIFAARDLEQRVCLIIEQGGKGGANCVTEEEFDSSGLTTIIYYGDIRYDDRPASLSEGESVRIEWSPKTLPIWEVDKVRYVSQ